jgi:hypothetical protein
MTTGLNILHGGTQGQTAIIEYAVNAQGLQGSAKIANKYACLFLRQYDALRNRGTNFITNSNKGLIRTDSSVITNFTAATLMILQQLGDQSALPASEQLAGAQLIGHTLFSDSLSMTIQLLTGDGTVTFVLPLTKVTTV